MTGILRSLALALPAVATGFSIVNLNKPSVGALGDEWNVIGLAVLLLCVAQITRRVVQLHKADYAINIKRLPPGQT